MIKLKRNSSEGVLGGVCEGMGDYFSIDPIIFRLAFIAFSFAIGGLSLIHI